MNPATIQTTEPPQERQRHRIGDDVGTGPSHSAYVEIRERWEATAAAGGSR